MRTDEAQAAMEDLDAAIEGMEELRDDYELMQRKAHRREDDSLYNYARNRKNAVQECINLLAEHDLY